MEKEKSLGKIYFSRIGDMFLLTLLWIIGSIPLITVGASTTAVYYVTLKIIRGEEVNIKNAFVKSFRDNIAQSTLIWIIYLVITSLIGAGGYHVFFSEIEANIVVKGILGILFVLYLFCFIYVFPLISRYVNTSKKVLMNSTLISVKYMDRTVKIILMYGIFAVVGILSIPVATLCFILLAPTIFFITTNLMLPIFEFLESAIVEEDVEHTDLVNYEDVENQEIEMQEDENQEVNW